MVRVSAVLGGAKKTSRLAAGISATLPNARALGHRQHQADQFRPPRNAQLAVDALDVGADRVLGAARLRGMLTALVAGRPRPGDRRHCGCPGMRSRTTLFLQHEILRPERAVVRRLDRQAAGQGVAVAGAVHRLHAGDDVGYRGPPASLEHDDVAGGKVADGVGARLGGEEHEAVGVRAAAQFVVAALGVQSSSLPKPTGNSPA